MKILVTGQKGQLAKEILESFNGNSDYRLYFLGRSQIDFRRYDETLKAIETIKPEIIVHTAAVVGGIKFNIENKYTMLNDNLLIDLNVINAALGLDVKNFLYFASSCMYPQEAKQPFETSSILAGKLEITNENYALAKIVGTKLTSTLDLNSNLNFKTLVLSNLYGPNDNFEENNSHVLASAIRKIIQAKRESQSKVTIWGTGTPKREFTLARDVSNWLRENISGLDRLPSILNLGTGVDFPISQIYETVSKCLNLELEFEYDATKPDGIKSKLMDSTLARELFSWNPTLSLSDGITYTLDELKKRGTFQW